MGNCCSTNIPTTNPFNSPLSHHDSCCQASKAGKRQRHQPLLSDILGMDRGHLVQELHAAAVRLVPILQLRRWGTPSRGSSVILFPWQLCPDQHTWCVVVGSQQHWLQWDPRLQREVALGLLQRRLCHHIVTAVHVPARAELA